MSGFRRNEIAQSILVSRFYRFFNPALVMQSRSDGKVLGSGFLWGFLEAIVTWTFFYAFIFFLLHNTATGLALAITTAFGVLFFSLILIFFEMFGDYIPKRFTELVDRIFDIAFFTLAVLIPCIVVFSAALFFCAAVLELLIERVVASLPSEG